MDHSLPAFSVQGILQARILDWVAVPSSKRSSQPRDQTEVSHNAGGFFTTWVTREAQSVEWTLLIHWYSRSWSQSATNRPISKRVRCPAASLWLVMGSHRKRKMGRGQARSWSPKFKEERQAISLVCGRYFDTLRLSPRPLPCVSTYKTCLESIFSICVAISLVHASLFLSWTSQLWSSCLLCSLEPIHCSASGWLDPSLPSPAQPHPVRGGFTSGFSFTVFYGLGSILGPGVGAAVHLRSILIWGLTGVHSCSRSFKRSWNLTASVQNNLIEVSQWS